MLEADAAYTQRTRHTHADSRPNTGGALSAQSIAAPWAMSILHSFLLKNGSIASLGLGNTVKRSNNRTMSSVMCEGESSRGTFWLKRSDVVRDVLKFVEVK